VAIALNRFIEPECGNTVDFCQVAIEHYSRPTDRVNQFINRPIATGDLDFFAMGDKDYSEIPPERSRLCNLERGKDSVLKLQG
jgi:hypothetical protein